MSECLLFSLWGERLLLQSFPSVAKFIGNSFCSVHVTLMALAVGRSNERLKERWVGGDGAVSSVTPALSDTFLKFRRFINWLQITIVLMGVCFINRFISMPSSQPNKHWRFEAKHLFCCSQ